MKRIVCSLLLACLLFTLIPINVYAAEELGEMNEVIRFDDGSYLTITVHTSSVRAAGSVSGKTTYAYNYGGKVVWEAVLNGSFSYTGSSATCTSSSVSTSSYDSAWYTVSKSAGRSGASATSSVTMGRKAGGITVDKVPISMKLTCDANGNLS